MLIKGLGAMEFPDYAFPSHANVKGVRGKIPAAEDQPRPPIRLRPCPLDAIREMLNVCDGVMKVTLVMKVFYYRLPI